MSISQKELNYYLNQGVRTKVTEGIYNEFPDEINKICRIIQGLLIHPGTLKELYNLNLPKERIQDRNIKTIQEILDKAKKLDNSPLTFSREPQKRVVAICKHFAMLLCSILREKGIPSRTRCGFATYFQGGWFEDHWICEYWDKKEKRWIRVDSQIDDIQIVAYHLDRNKLNFLDLPKGVFFPAGILWKLYRDGFIEGKVEGFSLEPEAFGEWYIRGNMLRDFFALNEIEYLYSEEDLLMKKGHKVTKKDLKLLDEIAEYTSNPDINFEKIRKLYKNNKKLIPK
ncbi:MAG: transglutaminase-like domain-containing protein [Candidatus Peregrinibacteria bacterium]|nr:transglutaminase-like domain-containing protein [Candidatus Peregrinibacteria bacterium]